MRKHILEYDDVLNKQRQAYYAKRQALLEHHSERDLLETLSEIIDHQLESIVEGTLAEGITKERINDLTEAIEQWVPKLDTNVVQAIEKSQNRGEIKRLLKNYLEKRLEEDRIRLGEVWSSTVLNLCLRLRDLLWMDHLVRMNDLPDSTTLRSYGQHEPLVEYKRESYRYWKELENNWEIQVINLLFKMG